MSARGWYIKLPVEFFDCDRVLDLQAHAGVEALGPLLKAIAHLAKRPGYMVRESSLGGMAVALGKSLTEMHSLVTLWSQFGLFSRSEDGEGFVSPDLLSWRNEFENRSKAAQERESNKRAEETKKEHSVTTVCSHSEHNGGTAPYISNYNYNCNSDSGSSKKEASQPALIPDEPKVPSVKFPPTLDTPGVRAAVDEFITYRKKLKKPLQPLSVEKKLAEYIGRPDELVAAINHTIAQGWQGLREPEQPRHAASRPQSKHERSVDAARKILEEVMP